jgi:hypothetical protein
LGGDIPIRITGDWIVSLSRTTSHDRPNFFVINLRENPSLTIPGMIKKYIETLGVKIIDYPTAQDNSAKVEEKEVLLEGGGAPESLVRELLELNGLSFTTQVEIPVYQSQKADYKLVIKADFFLKIKGRDAIIDLTGLAQEAVSLLEEHNFLVLSMPNEKNPLAMASRTLEFLGIQSHDGPHSFMAITGDDVKNVRLTLPGIVFNDSLGKPILATPLRLPDEIVAFLSIRAYRVLPLSFP